MWNGIKVMFRKDDRKVYNLDFRLSIVIFSVLLKCEYDDLGCISTACTTVVYKYMDVQFGLNWKDLYMND